MESLCLRAKVCLTTADDFLDTALGETRGSLGNVVHVKQLRGDRVGRFSSSSPSSPVDRTSLSSLISRPLVPFEHAELNES
ncbi:hypothetical protein F2P81_007218 [Scophthalmus maximus]|uniref:Uncharacterized protein n=1 Tax=Scophthalmus maximus TaxID=52904 RepID=A0A6A4TBY2_SCOMX|nr:hypothetical protein F2P81_007218 [Scophthalmus maximus]